MPELPEVEVVRQQLKKKVIGKTIAKVGVLHSKTVAHDEKFAKKLQGRTISQIDRIGKLLIISFAGESDLFLLVHLKMTGQLIYEDSKGKTSGGGHSLTKADTEELPGRHTRTFFTFRDGTKLYFNDMRLFGYTKLATLSQVEKARASFGPEPISETFDAEWFVKKVRERKAPIKGVLLDQKFVAGLGNIYVDEALWRARVRPMRRAHTLTKAKAALLAKFAGEVMRESIKVGGTTFQNFVDTGGENGNFSDYLKVFGRQGKKCERCGGVIAKTRVAGRGTHYCPSCQK